MNTRGRAAFRFAGMSDGIVLATQCALVAAFFCLWQFAPDSVLDDTLTSRPLAIAAQTWTWLGDGVLAKEAWFTLGTVLWGLALGGAAGVLSGLAAGAHRGLGELIEAPVKFVFALPKVTFVPLFIVWFGIGRAQESLYSALVVYFFFFYATFNGVRSVPLAMANMLTIVGSSSLQRIWLLYLLASLGWIIDALVLAVPYVFVSAVTAEIVSSQHGLGNLVKTSASVMDPAGMFAAMLTLVVLSVVLSKLFATLRGQTRWSL